MAPFDLVAGEPYSVGALVSCPSEQDPTSLKMRAGPEYDHFPVCAPELEEHWSLRGKHRALEEGKVPGGARPVRDSGASRCTLCPPSEVVSPETLHKLATGEKPLTLGVLEVPSQPATDELGAPDLGRPIRCRP